MTAAQVARKSGVSRSVLSDWLAGVIPRDIQHVKKVATVLGTSVDHLCFGNGVETVPEDVTKDLLGELMGEDWFGGIFEIRLRRVRRNQT